MTNQEIIQAIDAMRADPVLFVKIAFGVTPSDQQISLLNAIAPAGAHVSVRSGHGTGKTTCLAWIAIWHTALFPDSRAPCTAPTASQLENILWPEIQKWHLRMHPFFREQLIVTQDKLFVKGADKTQFAVARTARKEKPEALQGFHATHLLFVVDEASGVDDLVYEVAEGALSTPGARVILCSNPTRNSGYFHRTQHQNRQQWTVLHFNCLHSPLVSADYPKSMAEKYGEDSDIYRVRVMGQFPRASSLQLIPNDIVEAAMNRTINKEVYKDAPVLLGVDVARYGSNQNVIVRRQGRKANILWKGRNIDLMTIASKVNELWEREKPQVVFIDEPGLGAGVIDRLRQLGRKPIAVNGGKPASEEGKYANKRAEMWVRMRDWLKEESDIPESDQLMQDLTGLEYGFDSRERLTLEKKEDMEDRGLSSPDIADALALTFAENTRGIQKHFQQYAPKFSRRLT